MKPLPALFERIPTGPLPDLAATAITADSRAVVPGALFVAIRGERNDGHDRIAEAVAKGAAAVCVESDTGDPGIPSIRVDSTRAAFAELAAAWHGRPAEQLRLVGITGTVGKTSTLTMLERALIEGGVTAGTIGSLGVRRSGAQLGETSHTTPDPLALHEALARLLAMGCTTVAMEVSSHALVQERVHGLRYELGIFTNLLPLEHSDYHRSFREYVEVKRRFLDHLAECATVLYNADDRVVRRLVHVPGIEPVGCGRSRSASARVSVRSLSTAGTSWQLELRRPIHGTGGIALEPQTLALRTKLLGRSNVANASLAACAALCLGASPEAVMNAFEHFPPPRRRMEILRTGHVTILDDTVGHPDSISALFEVVSQLPARRRLIVWAVRGGRGRRINRESARTLAVWLDKVPAARLAITRSAEATGEHDVVSDDEYDAFVAALRGHPGLAEYDRLDDAVNAVLDAAEEGDLVLLLGAQGMDGGAAIVRARFSRA